MTSLGILRLLLVFVDNARWLSELCPLKRQLNWRYSF
jgi:hypothetical protein